jgi:hypothetical protein
MVLGVMDYELRIVVETVAISSQEVIKRDTVTSYALQCPTSIVELGLRHVEQIALLEAVRRAAARAAGRACACARARSGRGGCRWPSPRRGRPAAPRAARALWPAPGRHGAWGTSIQPLAPAGQSPGQRQTPTSERQPLPAADETLGPHDGRVLAIDAHTRHGLWLVCQPIRLWTGGIQGAISTGRTLPPMCHP